MSRVVACVRSKNDAPGTTGSAVRPPSQPKIIAPTHVATAIWPELNATRIHGFRSTNQSAISVESAEIQMPAPGPHRTAFERPAAAARLTVVEQASWLHHIYSTHWLMTTPAPHYPHQTPNILRHYN